MKIYIRGGDAGEMFMSECKECKYTFKWKELVVREYDSHGHNVIERHCVPCYEIKFDSLLTGI